MAKCWNGKGNQAIIYQLKKKKATKSDLGRLLDVGQKAIHDYINRPYIMRLEHISLMAGYFGVTMEELVYCISLNKPKINKADKWYLEGIRAKVDKTISPNQNG